MYVGGQWKCNTLCFLQGDSKHVSLRNFIHYKRNNAFGSVTGLVFDQPGFNPGKGSRSPDRRLALPTSVFNGYRAFLPQR